MKVLVTTQEPNRPRYRCIVTSSSTFDAINGMLGQLLNIDPNLNPNIYISARPATAEDIAQYGDA
jgi:hypothetical protein